MSFTAPPSSRLKAASLPHLWLPYCQMKTAPYPAEAVSTKDSTITLSNSQKLIDGIASWWTACHGYNHPHLQAALIEQAQKMPHIMFGGMIHEPAARLSERLSQILPGDLNHVFFTDSGSVAMEVAAKIALQFHLNRGEKTRSKLLSFRGGYHGDTLMMMSICDPEEGMHSLFGQTLPKQVLADIPKTSADLKNLRMLLEKDSTQIAAMIIEPLVQGAGGMIFHDAEILKNLRNLCDEFGILLILDEVFTGFGRTGTMFAYEQANIVPDIIALSKALTGGTMPLAATIAREHVYQTFLSDNPNHALMHGPTFMANPLACAVANASLDLFEKEPRLQQVQHIEKQLLKELEPCRALPHVKDVRVKGAIGVVELDAIKDSARLNKAFIEKNVWIRPFRNIIYLTPAFTIKTDELSMLTSAIYDVLETNLL
ncbi:adenosylmethionine--8-amino-7-oxononanoate transaminase [Aristophania vespae]|uniref:Adenosylmethionine-8-amino-7-oxononanoate aminotransferase n=1 Tax=Aristophania vespae TaxID=2697033 RepID=A0A6P1NF10_9PROT|nr:adenosylmethionine--8-amino-7-oxononanoate transaminase [Aristophania vespae]QHI95014.1 adenosylmethionine--8-amino-7-oxononanoate transaminase [Aristophania vespae]